MASFGTDLWTALKGDGIALDEAEAAALGAPNGETISIWEAMQARHGVVLARLMCIALWLVQVRHCTDQLRGVPMTRGAYARAFVLLLLFAPIAFPLGWLRSALRR
ncbi:MAG: hypothetical protein KGL35_30465 [Bradyrhizobium sp.]|nr:hypothetical protein [Bradyrhizobium sp.]